MSEFNQIINNNLLNLNFSGLLNSLNKISKAEFETVSIVFNQDQFEMMLSSMTEAKEGKVVSLQEAFADIK